MKPIAYIDEATLKACFPTAKITAVQAMARTSEEAFERYEVTDTMLAMALGQVAVESGGLTRFTENMNYSAKRLMQVFGVGKSKARITQAEANSLQYKPELIANRVYGTGAKAIDLGNTRPGDGWRFRGGGPIQITGRATYTAISACVGFSMVDNPDKARDPVYAWDMIFGFYKWKGILHTALNRPITAASIEYVTRRTNGGLMHLDEREAHTYRIQKILSARKHLFNAATTVGLTSNAPAPELADDPAYVTPVLTPEISKKATESDISSLADSVNTAISGDRGDKVLAEYGATGNEHVREFQLNLAERDYHLGNPDGDFGNITRDMLFAFQADNAFAVEPVLRIKHLERSRTANNRVYGQSRINVDKTEILDDSVTVDVSNKLKKGAITVAGAVGLSVTEDSSPLEIAAEVLGEQSKIVKVLSSIWSYLQPVVTSKVFWFVLASALASLLWHYARKLKQDRIDAHRGGRNLGR